MRLNVNIGYRKIIVEVVCLLYILLFVYAAVSKLLDFENFQVQLGQSPVLSIFSWWVSWTIPAIELIIVFLLAIPKYRTLGLFSALSLMFMFSVYIFIILNFSSFVPCSCGGILEKMGWTTHLIFNSLFVLLAIIALLFRINNKNNCDNFPAKRILILILLSSSVVIILFLSSENILHNENPFIRRFPQHPLRMTQTRDLKLNSYYFAGDSNGIIYLGNYTDPLHIISMDSSLNNRRKIKISFDSKKIPFTLIRVLIRGNFFYLMDGTVPVVYRGSILDWKVTEELKGLPYFNFAVPVDDSHIIFRSSSTDNSSVVGVFSSEATPKISYNKKILQKQIDGIFDTDGMLLYEEKSNKAVYLYYYRNEFVVFDAVAKIIRKGHTIDTNSTAKIKVAYLKNGKESTMAVPALMVNHHSAFYGNLLFVHSEIKGKYEADKLWNQASIIDVYDIEKATYVMSFAIYNTNGKKLESFYLTATHLYALIGEDLVVHELSPILKSEFYFPHHKEL